MSMPRRPLSTNRERILSAAFSTFFRNGLGRSSLEAVGRSAKLTKAAVLYHFPSKEALVCEAAKKAIAHNLQLIALAVDESRPAIQQLEAYYETSLRWVMDFPEEGALILLFFYQALTHAESAELSEQVLTKGHQRIRNYLLAAQREGSVDAALDVNRVAQGVQDSLLGGFLRMGGPGRTVSTKDFVDLRMKGLKAFLTPARG